MCLSFGVVHLKVGKRFTYNGIGAFNVGQSLACMGQHRVRGVGARRRQKRLQFCRLAVVHNVGDVSSGYQVVFVLINNLAYLLV